MKKIALFIAFGMIMSFASAQVKYVYCEIVGTSNILGTKVTIVIDYGESVKFGEDKRLKDDQGKVQKFNSMIDALNYMGDQGWEFVQAYVVIHNSSTYVYHYLLKGEIKVENQ
jgi:hypothetical protein